MPSREVLIVDDYEEKMRILSFIVKRMYRGEPIQAYSREEAEIIIASNANLGAGLIDCHLTDYRTFDGPEIIKFWRKQEQEKVRQRAYLCLQTSLSPDSKDFRIATERAENAGADAVFSHLPSEGDDRNPYDILEEILKKMKPYLLEETGKS